MNILFVTSYPLEYDTSGNIRNMGLIQGFVENGHKVSTFSPYPNDTSLFSGEMLDFPFEKRYWIGSKSTIVVDHTKKTLMGYLKRLASKIISNISVYDRRFMMARQIERGCIEEYYDLIVSSSDPKSAHIFAERLIKKNPNVFGKWIQYWGDPFTNDISNKHRFSEKKVKREERRLISIADKAVYVSPFTRDEMLVKYPDFSSKIDFLPIPFYKKGGLTSVKIDTSLVGYLGDYSSKNRNILPFVEAVKNNRINAAIAGTSDLSIKGTETLQIYGRLHGKAIDDLSARVGVYVCICNLHGTQIPGKVYHYVDSGKPILIILDGEREDELRKYFEGYNRFYLCGNNENDISQTLQRIMSEYHQFDTPQSLQAKGIASKFME